jgi:branched-subunit amino acid ABC-type transport system permease component
MGLQDYLLFAALGLGSGAIYASIAQGLVLMHRASGVINLAHGALAMYAIYAYLALRQGSYISPIPAVPSIDLSGPTAFLPAFLIAVASTALLGALAYLLVFRPLQHAPVLAKIVATVGLLVTISGTLLVHFPSEAERPLFVPQILPDDAFQLAGVAIPSDRLWLTGLVLAAAALLAALFRFTTFGLCTRASASSQKGAVLAGRSPQLIALGNWTLASALAGVFGVLVAPLMTIAPGAVVLLVVPSLAAAVVGRLSSFWVASLTGLALGMVDGVLTGLQSNYAWLPQQGLQTAAPLLIIILVVFLRGHGVVRRDDLEQDELPLSPRPGRVPRNALIGGALGLVALALTSGDIRLGLIVSLIGTLVCLSLVLVTGYLGQVSLMQLTFAGGSGLLLSALGTSAGIPFPLAPLIATAAAGALGFLVGVPALRIRGTSLAVVTLAAAVAVEQIVFFNSSLTGGVAGNEISAPDILGVDLSILSGDYPSLTFAVSVLVAVVLVTVLVANLRRSPTGLRMLAVRMNERAAASSGVDVAQTKLVGFMLAALIAGLAGSLFAYQQVRVSMPYFGIVTSLTFLAWTYVGGITSITGAFIGGLLIPGGLAISVVNEFIFIGQYQAIVAGVLLMANAVGAPQGIAGIVHEQLRRWPRSRFKVIASPLRAAELGGGDE